MITKKQQLLDILSKMQASHRLYQYEDDYEEHELAVMVQQEKLLALLCPRRRVLDLPAVFGVGNDQDP